MEGRMLRHFFPHGKRWGAWQRFRIPLGGASADLFECCSGRDTICGGNELPRFWNVEGALVVVLKRLPQKSQFEPRRAFFGRNRE